MSKGYPTALARFARAVALCDEHATQAVERVAMTSRNWERDSAILSYMNVDLDPVACSVCGETGATYSAPCLDEAPIATLIAA